MLLPPSLLTIHNDLFKDRSGSEGKVPFSRTFQKSDNLSRPKTAKKLSDVEKEPWAGKKMFLPPVDEPHELFETPEAAFAAANETLGQIIVVHLEFALDVAYDCPDHLDDGNDEGSEGHGAQVEDDGVAETPAQVPVRHILLLEGPIPLRESARQNQFTWGQTKIFKRSQKNSPKEN